MEKRIFRKIESAKDSILDCTNKTIIFENYDGHIVIDINGENRYNGGEIQYSYKLYSEDIHPHDVFTKESISRGAAKFENEKYQIFICNDTYSGRMMPGSVLIPTMLIAPLIQYLKRYCGVTNWGRFTQIIIVNN